MHSTRHCSPTQGSDISSTVRQARGLISQNTACDAPRLIASNPMAPEPQTNPAPIDLNPCPQDVKQRFPRAVQRGACVLPSWCLQDGERNCPPMMRMAIPAGWVLWCGGACAPYGRGAHGAYGRHDAAMHSSTGLGPQRIAAGIAMGTSSTSRG